ncbi:hypothetical protein NP233_g11406 [Leucocoprinus birnbaumii]|uniref:F-box domain-containing protein n=1 Tax=Leucocoprinus birnbaumii TaxID=56174 RepID=A0AAD5VIK1_9AGAR|nr:hypothetical protein NP233_g11406 [Leucocoprinus birnbaumii]
MAKADTLPTELLQKVATILYNDLDTLKNASLVNRFWRLVFQEVLFWEVRILEPGNEPDDNKLLLWFHSEPVPSQERVLSMVRVFHVGAVYDFHSMQHGRSTTIDKDHLSVLGAMSNLTSLNFSSSTFAWDRLEDPDLVAFIRVLNLPELKQVTFFCFPGCYFPLSFFLFSKASLACLRIKDVSPDPVNEAHSNPIYDELMNSLLALHSNPPSFSLSNLSLDGLGLASNFLDFMERHGLGWSDSKLLTHLELELTNTYYSTTLNRPNQAVVAGKFLMRFGVSLQYLHLHLECDFKLVDDSPLQPEHWDGSFAAGLGLLRNVETVELTLTVKTTIRTDAGAFAKYAWSHLSLALAALPQDNAVRHLLITCNFSLARIGYDQGGWSPEDQELCVQAIDRWLWRNLKAATRSSKYLSIPQWHLAVIFYWDESLKARHDNPDAEIVFSIQSPTRLPWLKNKSLINGSVYWDNRLLKALSITSIPMSTNNYQVPSVHSRY